MGVAVVAVGWWETWGVGWNGWEWGGVGVGWVGVETRRRTGVPRVDLELVGEIAEQREAVEHVIDVRVRQVEPGAVSKVSK